MKLSIGIIGLPNIGKSTLFKILTGIEVKIANYPFATVNPNVGVVAATDERLEKIAKIIGSKKILPAVFEFVDIAGLVKGAHQGQGLGNQFLARIREVDAIIHLVRIFKDKNIVYFETPLGDSGQQAVYDFETVLAELKLKDKESKEVVNLLSSKLQLVILNGNPEEATKELIDKINKLKIPYLIKDLKSAKEEKFLGLSEIFSFFREFLDLIIFYTANENEARSWFVRRGIKASQAVGVVHADFEKKFIKAEVIQFEKLTLAGSWNSAKQKGLLHLEGKDYLIQDGDVVLVKI